MDKLKKIMVTTDFSETAKRAYPAAASLARKYGAAIVLVHVEESRLPPLALEYTDVAIDHIVERQRERTTAQFAAIAREEFAGLTVETRTTDGIAHLEIVQFAEREGADLIVMSTHGRGFFSHAILGSTTERVVRRAPCPVLVVRGSERA